MALTAGLLCGLAVAALLHRGRLRSAIAAARAEAERAQALAEQRAERLPTLEARLRELESGATVLTAAKADLEARLASQERLLEERGQHAQSLKWEADESRQMTEVLRSELLDRASRLASAERAIALLEKRLAELQDVEVLLREREAGMAELEARLDAEDRLGKERLQALAEQRQQLRRDFETLAAKIFDAKTERFTRMSQERLGGLLQPVREQLKDFRDKVESVHLADARERASLREELKQLRALNQRIGDEALNLTRALKGDTRVQGSWGELVLERVLDQSGLRKGIEYHTQTSFRDAEQRLLRPDVIVHLPQGKDVVIDSKVSLVAYERYVSAGDESERARRLREHLLAVRRHMESLSAKDYSGLPDIRSLDLVLMFMPMEGAAMTAFQNDERLFQDAFDKRIVLVTPTTLLATLRTVESIWRHEHQNRNARAIAERAAALHDKLCGFVEEMERLGRQMTLAQGAYDKAMDRLTRGSGNLVRQARRFVDLGVTVKKTLPEVGLDATEEERKNEQTD